MEDDLYFLPPTMEVVVPVNRLFEIKIERCPDIWGLKNIQEVFDGAVNFSYSIAMHAKENIEIVIAKGDMKKVIELHRPLPPPSPPVTTGLVFKIDNEMMGQLDLIQKLANEDELEQLCRKILMAYTFTMDRFFIGWNLFIRQEGVLQPMELYIPPQ